MSTLLNIDSRDWSNPSSYSEKAFTYKRRGEFHKSIRAFKKSLNYCKEENQYQIREVSLVNIGAIYEGDLGDLKRAEYYYKKAIETLGLKNMHTSESFDAANLKPYLYKPNNYSQKHNFIPSYIHGDYSCHYIYQHIPKMGGRFVIDPIDYALRLARHFTLNEEGKLHYLYWRRIQSQAPLKAISDCLKEIDCRDLDGSLFIPHNINHRLLSVALSNQLNKNPTTISVIRAPDARLLSNIKFCLTNDGNDPQTNYPLVKKEILDNHEMYDNPLFQAFYTDLDEINSDCYLDNNLVCPLEDTDSILYFQSQMLSGLKLPNILTQKVIHQTKFVNRPKNEELANELYQLSVRMGHLEKDQIAFDALTKHYKSYDLTEGLIHPLTLCFDDELNKHKLVLTEHLFAN